jgi:hypothetical protein
MAGFRFIMKTILSSVLINQSGNFCLYLKSFRIIRAKEKNLPEVAVCCSRVLIFYLALFV